MNSCFVSFDYNLMFFSLFSDSAAFLFHLFHLFWRANQLNSKNAGVDKWRFQVFYGASIVLEVFLGQTGRSASCIGMKVRS